MTTLLEVDDVHTYYGESYILQGISLAVERGQVVAVLGRNGVGKTTLIRSIVGFTPPRRGTVRFNGQDVTRRPPYAISRLGVGLVPQGRRIFPSLTVREHLDVAAVPRPARHWTVDRVFQLFPALAERERHRGAALSGGEQQMLASGRALVSNPGLLLMDEPSEGLAPLVVREIGRIVAGLKAAGLSILLVEQNLPMALGVADRVYVLNRGRVVYEGAPDRLRADEAVKQAYLGV